ncbi:Nitroreductase [Lophium mytilinum]|uniref:Nitroreductase n=1 Tax=Lophium mytilinum TaxID=390894 RepID=A0A6A6QKK5_9PEZI|nr:Nitroreductase [Lophium mytilinum]
MASKVSFIDAVKGRRSVYALNKEAPISDAAIEQLVKDTVLSVPSFFNTQTTRVIVLLKDEHDKFWNTLVSGILKPAVPEDQWEATAGKLGAFGAGYGTILFYEDPEPVLALQKAYPIYADHMPTWSEHTSAMHQFVLWAGLEAEGFGANLQHYHPLIDAKVAEEWKVPGNWKLRAQLVFGGKAGEANEKTFKPIEERVFVHGK